jgi:hypothetical protein
MMTERLRAVIAQAEQLSDQEQEVLASAWEEILEEREWERIIAKPAVRDAGETEEITGDSFV